MSSIYPCARMRHRPFSVFRPGCGATRTWQISPNGCGGTTKAAARMREPAFTASTSTTCTARFERCRDLLGKALDSAREDSGSFLDAAQNVRLIASAERYYRIMFYGGAE